MTAEEFVEGYAARSDLTVEQLFDLGMVVVTCDCDFEECEGFGVLTRHTAEQNEETIMLPELEDVPHD